MKISATKLGIPLALSGVWLNFNRMKALIIFLAAACMLLAASCSMEKRLYRNGWYIEKQTPKSFPASPGISQKPFAAGKAGQKETAAIILEEDSAVICSAPAADTSSFKSKLQEKRKIKTTTKGDPLVKMTYTQARASMAKKGCGPDRFAMTIYLMSLGSVFTLLFVVGYLLAIATLVTSIFALRKIRAAGGPCMEENIAIIKAGRRISWGVVIFFFIAAIIFMLALVSFLTLSSLPGS